MKISVTRALSELKLLASRIENNIASLNTVAVKTQTGLYRANNLLLGLKPADFVTEAQGQLQSITDLIARRQKIKEAIVNSNAVTRVRVGGVEMSVASAIEQKTSIEYSQRLLEVLESQQRQAHSLAQSYTNTLEAEFSKLTNARAAGTSATAMEASQIEALHTAMVENRLPVIVAPAGLVEKTQALRQSIEAFLSDVDAALTEVNSVTMIEIPD